jgi:hypothetical protein
VVASGAALQKLGVHSAIAAGEAVAAFGVRRLQVAAFARGAGDLRTTVIDSRRR